MKPSTRIKEIVIKNMSFHFTEEGIDASHLIAAVIQYLDEQAEKESK